MVDGGEYSSDPECGGGDHHPLERVGAEDGDDIALSAAETQQVARRYLHGGVEFPERHGLSRRHVHLK